MGANVRQNGGRDRSYPPAPDPLPLPVTDSHCHLDLALGDEGLAIGQALAAAAAVNVTRVVQVGCDVESSRWAVDAAHQFPSVVASVALHPNEAPRLAARGALEDAFGEIEMLAMDPAVRAVGETGLDHFRTDEAGRPAQEESFRRHIDLSKRLGKALVIHDRDAHRDVLRVVDEESAPEHVVMHCFSGDADFARACVERGFVLSFAGTVTFANAPGLRDAAAAVPLDQLLVETDAPYLAPVPLRGKRCEPAFVVHTAEVVAREAGLSNAALAAQTVENTRRIFRLTA
jgi:TatD DNase family protein